MGKLNKIEKLIPGAVLLGISSLLSRVLGLVRDRILAGKFGASEGTGIFDIDVYYAAFRIPDFLFAVLIIGAVSTAFIPIFSRYIDKKKMKEAWDFASNSLNLIAVALLVLAVIAFILAPQIVKILTPGFHPEKLELTAKVTRIMLLSPIFFGLSSIAQSIQNTFKKFFYYALAPILYNLSIIVFAYFWSDQYGVYAATAGVITGALLHFLIQVPAIVKLGFKYRPIFDRKREDFREMVRLLIPRVLSISSLQINLVIETLIASTLATGSVAILNYAYNLNSLPMGIIGISIAIVSFATFSTLAGQKKHSELTRTVRKNLTNILFFIIPSIAGLIVLREEIVTLILGIGKFSASDIHITANMLGIMACGLIGQATIPLLARVFYAYKDTRTPMKLTAAIVAINIILGVTLVFGLDLGIYGIAIASAVANLIGFAIFVTGLKSKDVRQVLDVKRLTKFILISIAMGIITFFLKEITENLLLNTMAVIVIAAGFYFAAAEITKAMSIRELKS
ncbi:MAG: murein biosynthesis integral membrane protein MurJ [Patescibacteria group bacterium]|nr:murein biosynthesis integral membrane protein MurJ [Patescibacteria group bacterium]